MVKVLPALLSTPPHLRAINCEFDIIPDGIDTDMISIVYTTKEFTHICNWVNNNIWMSP